MLRPWQLTINIAQKTKGQLLYLLLAEEIQRLIETGVLHAGDVLPGSRELAQQLGISRKTVVSAMDRLVYGGLLERRQRVGLFVRCDQCKSVAEPVAEPEASPSALAPVASHLVTFRDVPDVNLLPSAELSRAYRMHFNRAAKWRQLDYSDPRGVERFRKALSMAMCHSRGMCVCADEVMITNGGQQSIYLAAHALLRPGDAIVVEELAHPIVIRAFETAGLQVLTIPVDHDGLIVSCLPQMLAENPAIRAIYVTPRVHYPTTASLSEKRREQLAGLVVNHDLLVIEDDFDAIIHLSGIRMLPLSALLPKENYIYVCTATRALAPVVRMGYVCASRSHICRMTEYRTYVDVQGDSIMECALLELIETGEVRRHIRHSIRLYGERLNYVSERLKYELASKVVYHRPVGGLAIWLEVRSDPTTQLRNAGIDLHVYALSNGRYGLRVGYAAASREHIDLLIDALKGL